MQNLVVVELLLTQTADLSQRNNKVKQFGPLGVKSLSLSYIQSLMTGCVFYPVCIHVYIFHRVHSNSLQNSLSPAFSDL